MHLAAAAQRLRDGTACCPVVMRATAAPVSTVATGFGFLLHLHGRRVLLALAPFFLVLAKLCHPAFFGSAAARPMVAVVLVMSHYRPS
jgi:hypothetical protein